MKRVGHKTDRSGQSDGCGGIERRVHSQTDGCMARKVAGAGSADALRMEGRRMGRGSVQGAHVLVLPLEESHLMNNNNEL